MASSITALPSRLSTAYWSAARVASESLAKATSTYEDISITSNQTKRLNTSPVRRAPVTPTTIRW
jgi:hypothetical protein